MDKGYIAELIWQALKLEAVLKHNNINLMFNLSQFISTYVTRRPISMFAADIEANKERLSQEI